jgi:hypothetical protein
MSSPESVATSDVAKRGLTIAEAAHNHPLLEADRAKPIILSLVRQKVEELEQLALTLSAIAKSNQAG